jgi:hypothetical protein
LGSHLPEDILLTEVYMTDAPNEIPFHKAGQVARQHEEIALRAGGVLTDAR